MLARGYKNKNTQQIINQIHFEDRKSIVNVQETPTNMTKPLIMTTRFSDSSHKVGKALRNHWHIIANNAELHSIFPTPPMVANRKNPSLANKLVRSKIQYSEDERPLRSSPIKTPAPPTTRARLPTTISLFSHLPMCRPCGERNCHLCKILVNKNFVTRHKDGTKYYIGHEGHMHQHKGTIPT